MKKIILMITIFSATSVLAQGPFTKGNFYAGIMLGISTQKDVVSNKTANQTTELPPSKSMDFIFNPEVSYFILDDLALGLNIGFESNKSEYTYSSPLSKTEIINKTSGPLFGLYARKFWTCSEKFATFMSAGVSMGSAKGDEKETITYTMTSQNSQTTSEDIKNNMRNVYINAGFSYNISPRVLIMGTFALISFYSNIYTYGITKDSETENKVTGVNFDINNRTIPFNLGFVYRLKPSGK